MRKAHRPVAAPCGFTILELVCALFILSTGLFGVITMYHFGITKMRTLHEYGIAMQAIENELETLRALPFAALEDAAQAPFTSDPDALNLLVNAAASVAIAKPLDAPQGLKRVTVRVRWTGEHGRTIEKRVTTFIADKGTRDHVQ